MSSKVDVVICLGSSCFARGNKNLLKTISHFIKENNIEGLVHFHGGHCFGNCAEGPILKVNGEMYVEVDDAKAIEILNRTFEI